MEFNHTDPAQVREEIRLLEKEGDYEGALQRHIWFHNHALEFQESYRGVRLSFALAEWVRLGEKFPKALSELRLIRDEKTKRLEEGAQSTELFVDVVSINRALREESLSLGLFSVLEDRAPSFAAEVFRNIEELVLAYKRYDIYGKYATDPAIKLDQVIEIRRSMLDRPNKREGFVELADAMFVEEVLQLIQGQLAIGNRTAAVELQKRALAIVAAPHLRDHPL